VSLVLLSIWLAKKQVDNYYMPQKHAVFITVPFTDTVQPLIAPAILKSVALKVGLSAATLDLNAEFNRDLGHVPSAETRHRILAFFREEVCYPDVIDQVYAMLDGMAHRIMALSPKIVGISVFTYNCRAAAKYLSWRLKKTSPNLRIVLGGSGILHHFAGVSRFALDLKKHGVIDEFIYGDGERTMASYLRGDTNITGLSTVDWQQMSREEIASQPMPDYDDYDFSLYAKPLTLSIAGSRGCVRKCTFCDVHEHWPRFTYRGGEDIFKEMVSLSEKHGAYDFHFTDSLINGNMREYRILMQRLADYNRSRPEATKLKWYSFFILRPRTAFREDDWRLTSEGGGRNLAVGIETVSESARRHLGKDFTNADIEWSFQMARKYGGIRFSLLFLTGYVTETEEDHQAALAWWPQQVQYQDVIDNVNTGSPLGILANTPLDRNREQLGIITTGANPEDWVNPSTDNTPERRVRWNREIRGLVESLGFRVYVGHDTHYILERMKPGVTDPLKIPRSDRF
jgi:hypothetical protein